MTPPITQAANLHSLTQENTILNPPRRCKMVSSKGPRMVMVAVANSSRSCGVQEVPSGVIKGAGKFIRNMGFNRKTIELNTFFPLTCLMTGGYRRYFPFLLCQETEVCELLAVLAPPLRSALGRRAGGSRQSYSGDLAFRVTHSW